MKLFITSGTFSYLLNIIKKHPEEHLILLHNNQASLLLHETAQSSLFNSPRAYDMIGQAGQLIQEGFIAMYHIPVSSEGQPMFEQTYKKHLTNIQNQSGFIAYRFLRPIGSESYIILTQWQKENAFKDWEKSATSISVNSLKLPIASAQKLFTGDPFSSKYSVPVID